MPIVSIEAVFDGYGLGTEACSMSRTGTADGAEGGPARTLSASLRAARSVRRQRPSSSRGRGVGESPARRSDAVELGIPSQAQRRMLAHHDRTLTSREPRRRNFWSDRFSGLTAVLVPAAHVDGLGTFACDVPTILVARPHPGAEATYPLPWSGRTVTLVA